MDDQRHEIREHGNPMEGVVQLRYTDESGSVRSVHAGALVQALQGMVDLTKELHRGNAFGSDFLPGVHVRPAREGSFIVDVLILSELASDVANNERVQDSAIGGAVGATTTIVLTQSMNLLSKLGRGAKVKDAVEQPDGRYKLQFSDDTVKVVQPEVWETLNERKHQTKRAMQKLLAPLRGDADTMEVRGGSTDEDPRAVEISPVEFSADLVDYRNFAEIEDDVDEAASHFETEILLLGIDFRPDTKWTVKATGQAPRKARMDDEDFLSKLDAGHALRKGDILQVKIKETAITKNGRTRRDWSIVEVFRTLRGGHGDDGNADRDESSPQQIQN